MTSITWDYMHVTREEEVQGHLRTLVTRDYRSVPMLPGEIFEEVSGTSMNLGQVENAEVRKPENENGSAKTEVQR